MKILLILVVFLLSSEAYSDVLFNDPDGKELSARFSELKSNEVNGNAKTPEIDYINGVMHFNGNEKFGIKKDPKKAVAFFERAWKESVWDAGYPLSWIYYKGIGVKQDYTKSKYYLEQSAKKGLIISQKRLAKAYWGDKLKDMYSEDIDSAVYWFEKSANQGDSESALILSRLYLNDEEVDKDLDESFKWVKKGLYAKYDTSGIAPYIAAEYYEKGWGVDKDLILAYKYYDLSGTAGSKGKSRVSKNMTETEIQEAIKQSRAWQEKHNTFVPSYYGLEHQADGSYR